MDEEDEEALEWGNRCSPRWWNSCCRLFRCPCARPKKVKPPKNPRDLKTISIEIPLKEKDFDKRPDNVVVTSKYTIWTFVPFATALQFRRAVNVFYLFQVILLIIGYYFPQVFNSPFSPWGTFMILVFVIAVTLIFEGRDDIQRHRTDRKTNSTKVSIVYPETGERKKTIWGNLRPGSLVVLRNRELVPADVVIIETSDPGARVYIETSGIDGETNLKIRQVGNEMKRYIRDASQPLGSSAAVPSASSASQSHGDDDDDDDAAENLRTPSEIEAAAKKMVGTMEYEEPNPFLQFSGKFIPSNAGANPAFASGIPVGFESVLLRGSEIRNTKWVLAVVVYAGHETKLILSKKDTPSKFSTMDILTNNLMYLTMLELLVMNILAVIMLFFWAPNTDDIWYFDDTNSLNVFVIPGWLAYFFTFNILLANVVPISLYVCVEIATFAQGYFVDNDLEMYDSISDTPAKARTGNLISEIGQITHLFSDKTGTLTQNIMNLIGMSVGGFRYGVGSDKNTDGYESEESTKSSEPMAATKTKVDPTKLSQKDKVLWYFRNLMKDLDAFYKGEASSDTFSTDPDFKEKMNKIEEFLIFLAVCHTVIIDLDDEGNIRYNAEGPDEEALVKAAAALGFVLSATDDNGYKIVNTRTNESSVFNVIAVNGFTSDRKRMSILVQKTEGSKIKEYRLLMKGADNIMFERLRPEYSDPSTPQSIEKEALSNDLTYFAESGLRTLVMCARTLSEQEFNDWMSKYQEAKLTPGNQRKAAMDNVADMIEQNCDIVGASAIEDALQEGVPETIELIRQAGINVWVLTGDKVETAINIGFSANLLDKNMFQIILDEQDKSKLIETIDITLDVLEKLTIEAKNGDGKAKNELGESSKGEEASKATDIRKQQTGTSSIPSRVDQASALSGKSLQEAEEGISKTDGDEEAFLSKQPNDESSKKEVLEPIRPVDATPVPQPEDEGPRPIQELWDTQQELALIITGKTLELLLEKQKGDKTTENKFVALARSCSVVIACRVSPSQKALIVRSVVAGSKASKLNKPITMSVGDGANDVAMIQEAKVGVGISGMEGRQAVNNSDFSIAQFRFLQRLLLVHGRWNYRRNSRLLIFICYSYQVLNFMLFGYLFYSMVSGQQLYSNSYYITLYSWFAGPMAVGFAWFDKDITAKTSLDYPMAYSVGRENEDLRYSRLWGMILRSIIHSAIIWTATFYVALPLHNNDIAVLGSTSYMATVWTVLAYQFMTGRTWTWLMLLGVLILLFAYPLLVSILDLNYEGTALMFTTAATACWPAMFWSVGAMIMLEHLFIGGQILFFPSSLDVLIERDAMPYYRPGNVMVAAAQGRRILLPVEKIRAAMRKQSASTRRLTEMQKQPSGYVFGGVENGNKHT